MNSSRADRGAGSRLRIGIDARSLGLSPSGVRTYVTNLLQAIPYLDGFSTKRPKNNFLWNNLVVPSAILSRGWRVFHAPGYTSPLITTCPLVLSVHDVAYLVRPDWYPYELDRFRLAYYRASLRAADRILVPSEFSAGEVRRLFPALSSRVRTVHLGVSESFFPDEESAAVARQQFGLPSRFLLHVGDIHPRRKMGLIEDAARHLGLPLVAVGSLLRGGELAPDSLHFSRVSVDQLRGIYSAASVLVYPSVYEGFGFPLVEAMSCGLPVVGARRGSIPEVCGEAAVLVEPDVPSIIEGIQVALEERAEFVQKGLERANSFKWSRTAQETCKVYEELF